MRRPETLRRTDRDNPGRIDIVVSEIIMAFDVVKIHRIGNAIGLIEIAQIPGQVRVVNDPSDVTFEMTVINRVEPDQRNEQSPVCFER